MKFFFSISLLFFVAFFSEAQISQWRGPARDGKFNETGLLKEWPAEGPELLLTVEGIGKGYSSPIAEGRFIYTTGMIDSMDYASCIDMTGKAIWQVPYGRSWMKSFPDTRGSVTIDGDRLYIISGEGELVCINKTNGVIIWKVDVDKDYESERHVWGVSETPLIIDDKVICTPGGKRTSVVAFNKINGDFIWESECVGGQRAYTSPTFYQYKNFRYILATTANNLIALVPETGKVAWNFDYFKEAKWEWQPGLIWTNTPIYKDDEIYISKGYDFPSIMLKMDSLGTSVSKKWVDHTLDNHHHGVVEVDGKIYGSNWKSNREGKWVCMDWNTGEIEYVADWYTKGSMVYADGMLYVYEERTGHVGLVKPDPKGFEVVSSFKVTKGTGPHWAHPFIADGKLFLRHGDVLLVYNIKA
jgi:outer membrane protein assembly factor BamB